MRELHLFAGAGGGILGGILLGHTCVCAVEIEPYCRKVLFQRQRDGILPKFPIWDDVRTFDGKPWRGLVDVVCGGFPCQDISIAGTGAGIDGKRSGLWRQMARLIREVRPRFVFVENSPMLTLRGLGRVLGDLAALGFNAHWGVFSCREVGGVHLRERIFIFGSHTDEVRRNRGTSDRQGIRRHDATRDENRTGVENTNAALVLRNGGSHHAESSNGGQESELRNGHGTPDVANAGIQRVQGKFGKKVFRFRPFPWGEDVRGIEDLLRRSDIPQPLVRRIGNDVADGVDRLKSIGNGQVPRVVAVAWEALSGSSVEQEGWNCMTPLISPKEEA